MSDTAPAAPPADIDLDAIRARVDAATDGPWFVDDQGFCTTPGDSFSRFITAPYHELDILPEDAEFIAAARSDVPALLAEIERLRSVVAAQDTDETTLRAQLCACGRAVNDHDKQWHAGYDQACEDAAAVAADSS
jgi:hypothetical protein